MVLRMNLALGPIIDTVMIYMTSTGVAMLDFDEIQEFPKVSSWASKSDFICDLMGTQNHQKTLYFPDCRFCYLLPSRVTRASPNGNRLQLTVIASEPPKRVASIDAFSPES